MRESEQLTDSDMLLIVKHLNAAVNCQSDSKCTVQVTVFHLMNAVKTKKSFPAAGKVTGVSPELS